MPPDLVNKVVHRGRHFLQHDDEILGVVHLLRAARSSNDDITVISTSEKDGIYMMMYSLLVVACHP